MNFKIGDILNIVDNLGNIVYADKDAHIKKEYRVVGINQSDDMKYKLFIIHEGTIMHISTEGRARYEYLGTFVLSKKSKRNHLIDNLIEDV